MTQPDNRQGIFLMIAVTFVFAMQDGISRHLASEYNVIQVVMLRFWFLAAVVVAVSARQPGGVRAVAKSARPWLQALRGVLLGIQICVMVLAFVLLGLVESLAVFTCYPLVVAALSGPVLGERVGPVRWAAIAVGFCGILLILRPGLQVFSPAALVPLCAAAMFALYALLTRYAARFDGPRTAFFWMGVAGALTLTLPGLWSWEWLTPADSAWMAVLCMTGALGHWLLIRCYTVAEVSAVQPFAYLQFVFGATVGILVFGEALEMPVAAGAAVVVAAGVFTLLRERKAARNAA